MYKHYVTVLNAAHLIRMGMAKSIGIKVDMQCINSSYVKSGLKANKAGRRDTAAEFSTVPPKSGWLTLMDVIPWIATHHEQRAAETI